MSDYEDSISETIAGRNGTARKVTRPLPPITLSSDDVAWLNAYNTPHWMQFFPAGGSKLTGWVNKTNPQKPVEAMGVSWVYDLMAASQDANKTADGKARPALWFAGTNSLGNRLNLGINTDYISQSNQESIDGDEWLFGLRADRGGITPDLDTGTWNFENSLTLA